MNGVRSASGAPRLVAGRTGGRPGGVEARAPGRVAGASRAPAAPEPKFELRKAPDSELMSLTIRLRRPIPATADFEDAKVQIVECYDEEIGLALAVYVNDRQQMIVAEGPETPWFLDEEQLTTSIVRNGAWQTYRDIIAWIVHPLSEFAEVSE